MNCLNDKDLFDLMNQELSEYQMKKLTGHLNDCKKCKTSFNAMKNSVSYIQNRIHLLEPDTIPERSSIIPERRNQVIRPIDSQIHNHTNQPKMSANLKKVIVFSMLLGFISIFMLHKKRAESKKPEMWTHIFAIEQSFLGDAKSDYNENSFYIIFYDTKTKMAEITRKSLSTQKSISKDIIKINE
jgi:hypothetical protein